MGKDIQWIGKNNYWKIFLLKNYSNPILHYYNCNNSIASLIVLFYKSCNLNEAQNRAHNQILIR